MKNRKLALALGLAVLLIGVARYTYAANISVGAANRATTPAQDAVVLGLLRITNGYNCKQASLPPTCTQVQYDAAPGHIAGTVIYLTTAAGQHLFILDRVFVALDSTFPQELQGLRNSALQVALAAATPAQFSAACTALGKDPNTCL